MSNAVSHLGLDSTKHCQVTLGRLQVLIKDSQLAGPCQLNFQSLPAGIKIITTPFITRIVTRSVHFFLRYIWRVDTSDPS